MKTVTVTLIEKTKSGTDPFNLPVYDETEVSVDGVLVGEPSTEDITNAYITHGSRLAYTLAIPKGDEHDWTDTKVILPDRFAGTYHTVGKATAGIEGNIPLRWNKKVHLETYEQSKDQTEQNQHQGGPSI